VHPLLPLPPLRFCCFVSYCPCCWFTAAAAALGFGLAEGANLPPFAAALAAVFRRLAAIAAAAAAAAAIAAAVVFDLDIFIFSRSLQTWQPQSGNFVRGILARSA
jgi:hypothetical protein